MNKKDWDNLKEEISFRVKTSTDEAIEDIAFHVQMILQQLGQNISDENLKDTPLRVARHFYDFLNYDPGNFETSFQAIKTDQLVIVKKIPFWSLCAHHLLFFHGEVSVGYLTGEKVIGLSKIPRIVQKHAHKLQLQEKLAHDIADELEGILDAKGVAIIVKAEHSCMQARGIKSEGEMITSVLRGQFRNESDLRIEFFNLLNS